MNDQATQTQPSSSIFKMRTKDFDVTVVQIKAIKNGDLYETGDGKGLPFAADGSGGLYTFDHRQPAPASGDYLVILGDPKDDIRCYVPKEKFHQFFKAV